MTLFRTLCCFASCSVFLLYMNANFASASDSSPKNSKLLKKNLGAAHSIAGTKSKQSLTGTYKAGNDALGSELVVKEIPGTTKIKFSLYSFWRCPDNTACNGMAEAEVPLINNTAVFTNSEVEYVLTMRFKNNVCVVDCDRPSKFGGFNVNPNGTYRKISRAAKF